MQLFGRPQWLTVRWRSQNYVNKVLLRHFFFLVYYSDKLVVEILLVSEMNLLSQIKESLESRGCRIRTNAEVCSVSGNDEGE